MTTRGGIIFLTESSCLEAFAVTSPGFGLPSPARVLPATTETLTRLAAVGERMLSRCHRFRISSRRAHD